MLSRFNLTPTGIEQLRRSVVMLTKGQPANFDRDDAIVLLEEIQRLQARNRRLEEGMAGAGDALAELETRVRQLLG